MCVPIKTPPSNQTIGWKIGWNGLTKQFGGRNQKKGNQ